MFLLASRFSFSLACWVTAKATLLRFALSKQILLAACPRWPSLKYFFFFTLLTIISRPTANNINDFQRQYFYRRQGEKRDSTKSKQGSTTLAIPCDRYSITIPNCSKSDLKRKPNNNTVSLHDPCVSPASTSSSTSFVKIF